MIVSAIIFQLAFWSILSKDLALKVFLNFKIFLRVRIASQARFGVNKILLLMFTLQQTDCWTEEIAK